MAEKMKPIVALKTFFEKDAERKVTLPEMKEFLVSMSPEEKRALARVAAKELGVELDES